MHSAYVNYDYYKSEYLLGVSPVVPEEKFDYWEKQAAKEIDQFTYGRIKANSDLICDEVKECTCAIAELLYKADTLTESVLKEGMTGVITSYNNDGQSASFDVSQSIYTETGKKKEIRRIIQQNLGNTGLLYRGVKGYESKL